MPSRSLRTLPLLLALLGSLPTSWAAVSIYMTPEDLAARAPFAFEASVVEARSGYDPVTARIATYVTLDVARVLRGPAAPGRVVLRERGGTYGDLVHVAEGSPEYAPGERVLVFAEAMRDGALRTAGAFFGRFEEPLAASEGDALVRRLDGRGTILRAPAERTETYPRQRLIELASNPPAATAVDRFVPGWRAQPEEMSRLLWSGPAAAPPALPDGTAPRKKGKGPSALNEAPVSAPTLPAFAPLSISYPARWEETDAGGAITLDVERARDPLANPAAAVAEIVKAVEAWTAVPESRAIVRLGNTDARYTGPFTTSPADVYPGSSIVLFGDPYDDLSDPASCSGTLALGGYWRAASAGRTVNGVPYYPIRRAYVIFNRNFECFLGDARNLAEIATHEIGHGLGFGHSPVAGAIMRGFPYGARGALLDADDRNAAHCVYPHTLQLTSPNGGEHATPGSTQTVRWTSTSDASGDSGTVDLELSLDAGATWSAIATATPNDGTFDWTVPGTAGTSARLRVVRKTLPVAGNPGGSVCSQDTSNASFTIDPPPSVPGTIADGGDARLVLGREAGGDVTLSWGEPCGTPTGYAVYAGFLESLRADVWDHVAVRCAGATPREYRVHAEGADQYYLVSAVAWGGEGSLGAGSDGKLRPESPGHCAARAELRCP